MVPPITYQFQIPEEFLFFKNVPNLAITEIRAANLAGILTAMTCADLTSHWVTLMHWNILEAHIGTWPMPAYGSSSLI